MASTRATDFIRLLRSEDADAFGEAALHDPWFESATVRVREELAAQKRGEGFTLVAEVNGKVVGTLRLSRAGREGWVQNVAVSPAFQGRGIASRLLHAAARKAAKLGVARLFLHVRRGNIAAIRAYEKAGFRFVGVDGMDGEQLKYERMVLPCAEKRCDSP